MKTNKHIVIRSVQNIEGPWYSFNFDGLTGQAKVFDEPSQYGINQGRISKLSINGGDISLYNYDRGLDFSYIKDEVIEEICKFLETYIKPESSAS